jgi:dienelactone hydrolase
MPLRKWARWTTVLGMLFLFSPPSAAAQWKAGVAKLAITPEKPMWLSGYGGRTRPAEGKLTDLWAKALVLADEKGERAVLVTLDLVGIDRDVSARVCREIMSRQKLARDRIALCCSHTHSGPVVGDNLRSMYFYDDAQDKLVREYTTVLEKKIVEVVDEAAKHMKPARLAWGVGKATIAVNRRNNREKDVPKLRAEGKLSGPVDHDVPVLAVRDETGKLVAIVCGYACHATVLDGYEWCGDWPGYAQIELEKRHPGATALYFAGCGGDQNPLPRRKVELAQEYGRAFAASVDEALAQRMQPIQGSLRATYSEIDVPFAKLPTRDEMEQAARGEDRYAAARAKRLLADLERNGTLRASYPYPIQAWQLGQSTSDRAPSPGVTLVFLGGEVLVDYALLLKSAYRGQSTWVAAYSNDVMAYIPSRRVLREGGYEGSGAMLYYGLPSAWSESAEEQILAEVKRQLMRVRDESPAHDRSTLLISRDANGSARPIQTAEQWQQRRNDILAGLEVAMGALPNRKNLPPLDVRELKREQHGGYVRLTISFAAHLPDEPEDRVPTHLYLPAGVKPGEKRPAVLVLHQTSPQGKLNVGPETNKPNLASAAELVRRGYVVLAPDYPSFGDYKYDFAAMYARGRFGSGTMKGIFNHMRAVDLLCERPEVDRERIGVIGHSLGGHNAMFVGAFDERLKVIVSSSGWTPFADYYGGKIAGWTSDRYMPRLRDVFGLDAGRVPFEFDELVAALAPRAFFSNSPIHDDNFDVAGVKKASARAADVFKLLGAAENLVVRYPDCGHDFPPEVRQEAYRFMDRILTHK